MNPSTPLAVDWEVDDQSWSEALAQCPGATFYHTGAWLAAVEETFRSQVVRARVRLGRDRWALLPLSVRPLAKGLVPFAVAGETGVYGGLVSPEPLTDAEVTAAFDAIRKRYPDLQVVGNPFAPGPHLPFGGVFTATDESTHVLPLKEFSQLRAGFSRGAKSRGNKARKHGFELCVRSDEAGVDAFYPLYEDSMKRWGDKLTWPRPRSFFETMVRHGAPDVTFFLAMKDGEAVSALLMASYGKAAHYVAGATRADQLEASPANFLVEEALARYAADGFEYFDFGPSSGLAGVVQFKESFGARPAPFYALSSRTLAGRAYFALRAPLEKLSAWRQQSRHEARSRTRHTAA